VIERALAALVAGDVRGALEHLLAAWRRTPARALAEAIEVLGAFAARGVHPPPGTTPEDREEMWLAEARRGDPVMRQRLVETLADTYQPEAKVARARALAEIETDPRTAMGIVALVTSPRMPYTNSISTVWNPLFALLATGGDPRVREAVARAPWTTLLGYYTTKQRDAFLQRLARYDGQLAAALPAAPSLDDEAARMVYEIVQIASAPPASDANDRETEAALLAAIHAAPGDTGPRAIYADWLQERGDPRGEFIALQLAHPGQVPQPIALRLRELLAQHRSKWLGELEPYIKYERWRGGFLDVATFHGHGTVPPHPAWSTLREVTGAVPASDDLPLPILEIANDVDERGLSTLAALTQPPPLVTLGWNGGLSEQAVADFAAFVPRVPTLRRFVIASGEDQPWAWEATSIRELVVGAPSDRLAHWLERAVGLDKITVKHPSWTTTLAAGELIAKQDYSGNFDVVLPELERALVLVAARVSRVEITVAAKSEWRSAERRRMGRLLLRHPSWATRLYGYTPPSSYAE
jgi:uncharacterized protein (TIGR02996 family)